MSLTDNYSIHTVLRVVVCPVILVDLNLIIINFGDTKSITLFGFLLWWVTQPLGNCRAS